MDYSILQNKTVLIADDEAIILKVASQFFLHYGCNVIAAPNGKVALDLAEEKSPNLIIMDWNMPVMNGIEATKALKINAATKHIPIIIATGISESHEYLHEALSNGADDYLTKPLDERVMVARAIAVLRLYDMIKLVGNQNGELLRYKKGLKSFKFITSDGNLKLDTQLEQAMTFMLRYFNMQHGIISKINHQDFEVQNKYAESGVVEGFNGLTVDLNTTICKNAFESDKVFVNTDIGDSLGFIPELDPDTKSYIGMPLVVNGLKYGTVCFISNKVKEDEFHDNDLEFMQLFGRWVGYAIERAEQTDSLIAANISKDRILATVAHDLRNPIQAIQGVTTILKLQMKNADPRDLEVIGMIDSSCKTALNLISELLESSEMESTSFKLRKSPTAIDIFIRRTLKTFEQRIEEKNQALVLDFQCEDTYVDINHQKFARVIENLVSNAIKFTPENGKIFVNTNNLGDNILIEIRDTGIGVPVVLQPVIFDKFSKAGRSGLKGEKSTGLGMYIVKQIVELHGGEISLESLEGEGACFKILIPYTED